MNVTFLISVKDPKNLVNKTKEIIDNIAAAYPKGKTEIVFLVISQEDTGVRTYNGVPLVRIKYFDNYVDSLNHGVKHALGDFILFCEADTRFTVDKVLKSVECFNEFSNLMIYMGYEWQLMKKSDYEFPKDLFCLRSYLIMEVLITGRTIIGGTGRLNRKEVLRFAYKMDRIRFKDKLKLIWGCR